MLQKIASIALIVLSTLAVYLSWERPRGNPALAPSTFEPPAGILTAPPTVTPWPDKGQVSIVESGPCGQGCWKIVWTSPDTNGGFVLFGIPGYPSANNESADKVRTDTYSAELRPLSSGQSYQFQAVALRGKDIAGISGLNEFQAK